MVYITDNMQIFLDFLKLVNMILIFFIKPRSLELGSKKPPLLKNQGTLAIYVLFTKSSS